MSSFSFEKIFPNDQGEFSIRRLFEKIFIEDWMMKLIALIITLALWFGVTGLRTPTTERLKNVTLKIRVSNEMEITNSPVQEVDLVISGDSRRIDQIRREDLIVSLDLGDALPGERTVEITPENVNDNLPPGVKLEEVQPSKIAITLEKVEKREIPVRAVTENNLPEGYEIYSMTVAPKNVPLRGPASFINSIDYVSTEPIDLSEKQADFTAQQVPLKITNPKITVIDESVVDVFFRIGEKRIDRVFIVPVSNLPGKRTATLVLYGPRTILNAIDSSNMEAQLVLNESGTESLQFALPAEIQSQVVIKRQELNGK